VHINEKLLFKTSANKLNQILYFTVRMVFFVAICLNDYVNKIHLCLICCPHLLQQLGLPISFFDIFQSMPRPNLIFCMWYNWSFWFLWGCIVIGYLTHYQDWCSIQNWKKIILQSMLKNAFNHLCVVIPTIDAFWLENKYSVMDRPFSLLPACFSIMCCPSKLKFFYFCLPLLIVIL
jgi:hypothetical protein